jgi:putative ABC transport system ATP-binding protein
LNSPTSPDPTRFVASLRDVVFAWQTGSQPVLRVRQFDIAPRERIFLRGPSGSGKSTLLNLLAGVAVPQQGAVPTSRSWAARHATASAPTTSALCSSCST